MLGCVVKVMLLCGGVLYGQGKKRFGLIGEGGDCFGIDLSTHYMPIC